jgi:hypothetical protein
VVLHEFSTPDQVKQKGVDEIVKRWKQDKIRAVVRKRAERLVEAAKISTGITEGLVAADIELKILLDDYDQKMQQ